MGIILRDTESGQIYLNQTGIVTLSNHGMNKVNRIVKSLNQKDIIISEGEEYFKISPQYYNIKEEIHKVFEHLFTQ